MAVLVDVWFQPQYHVTIDHDKVEALARTTTWAFYHAAGGSGVGVSREVDDGDDVNALVEETKAELQMLFGVEDTAYDVRFAFNAALTTTQSQFMFFLSERTASWNSPVVNA